jgi:uncharacterized membrane protein YgcG
MCHRCCPRVLLLALVLDLVLLGRAGAVAPQIKDEGKFFSADAVKKANEQIRDIARKYGRDLLIETFPKVPDDQVEKVKAMSKEERQKYFIRWAQQRMSDQVVNGVYILITKEPAHLRVEVAPKAGSVFSRQDRNELARRLVGDFREKRYDDGLQAAVKFVEQKLANRTKDRSD